MKSDSSLAMPPVKNKYENLTYYCSLSLIGSFFGHFFITGYKIHAPKIVSLF